MDQIKKTYTLRNVCELKKVHTIDEANYYLKENWLLIDIVTNNKNIEILIGRIR